VNEQLELAAPKTSKSSASSVLEGVCHCGHDDGYHAKGLAGCTYGAHVGNVCPCKRFRRRGRKPVPVVPALAAPAGALELVRPDTKRRKRMGWALVGERNATIYLEQLRTKSPNVTNRIFGARLSPDMQRRIIAGQANERKGLAERTLSAIEQAKLVLRGKPERVVVTRISSGKLDDDNLVGALKFVRDGIAEALLFDDRLFEIGTNIFYKQAAAGVRGAYGVRLELFWGKA
jgi:hypothetical protein